MRRPPARMRRAGEERGGGGRTRGSIRQAHGNWGGRRGERGCYGTQLGAVVTLYGSQHYQLRYDWRRAYFTDGSVQRTEKGPQLVGAAVWRAQGGADGEPQTWLVNPNGCGPTNTINRAEGSAILAVLLAILEDDEHATIFTTACGPSTCCEELSGKSIRWRAPCTATCCWQQRASLSPEPTKAYVPVHSRSKPTQEWRGMKAPTRRQSRQRSSKHSTTGVRRSTCRLEGTGGWPSGRTPRRAQPRCPAGRLQKLPLSACCRTLARP